MHFKDQNQELEIFEFLHLAEYISLLLNDYSFLIKALETIETNMFKIKDDNIKQFSFLIQSLHQFTNYFDQNSHRIDH